jgi:hypothetical protein
MSVSSVVTALQTLHSGISGVKAAPTALSGYYDTAKLPLVWTHPGPTPAGGGWAQSADLRLYDRIYIVRCLVMPEGQGRGTDEGYQAALALIQKFGDAYLANPNLSGQIAHFVRIEDTGVAMLDQGQVKYHGFEFRLTVREKVGT